MEESRFEGTLLGLIGINLLTILFIVLSLGLATPWVVCFRRRWFVRKTVINGKRFIFVGTGWQFLGNFLKWVGLTIITLFIYLLWVPIRYQQWITKHTHFYDEFEL